MMTSSTLPREAGPSDVAAIEIVLPEHWWELPLHADDRDEAIAALVDRRVRRAGELAPYRDGLVSSLRTVAANAAAIGAVYCAQAGVPEDAVSAGAGAGVPATLLVVLFRVDDPARGSLLDWATNQLGPGGSPGYGGAEIEVVELPLAGQAVRAWSRWPHREGTGTGAQALLVQYFVPVPDYPAIAILAFSSPSIAYQSELTELFDTMACTFAFTDADGEVVVADTPLLRVQ